MEPELEVLGGILVLFDCIFEPLSGGPEIFLELPVGFFPDFLPKPSPAEGWEGPLAGAVDILVFLLGLTWQDFLTILVLLDFFDGVHLGPQHLAIFRAS